MNNEFSLSGVEENEQFKDYSLCKWILIASVLVLCCCKYWHSDYICAIANQGIIFLKKLYVILG